MAAIAEDSLDSTNLYTQLDEYPWDGDHEFQGGLNAILGSVQNPAQVEHLTSRAKCYYYARKTGTPVDFNDYKRWLESNCANGTATAPTGAAIPDQTARSNTEAGDNSNETSGGMGDAPNPASFAEICDMIAEGKPIPGIKDIPDIVLEGQKSESQKEQRRKPWENRAATGEKPSWMS